MTTFTIITGIVTLLGFLIQLRDIFPAHREARKTFVILLAGIFLGILVSAINGARLEIGRVSGPVGITVAVIMFCILLFALTHGVRSITARTAQDRSEALSLVGGGMVTLVIWLFIGFLTFSMPDVDPARNLTVDETLALVAIHEKAGNFDRAIFLARELKVSLVLDDPRRKDIDKLLSNLTAEEFSNQKEEK
jgi:hypothetical protein